MIGQKRCSVEHVGLVLAGSATAAFADGRVIELRVGELFHIPPEPHDSWVVGDEPYVSLHFLGADHYEQASYLSLLCAGLHVALNWDLIAGGGSSVNFRTSLE